MTTYKKMMMPKPSALQDATNVKNHDIFHLVENKDVYCLAKLLFHIDSESDPFEMHPWTKTEKNIFLNKISKNNLKGELFRIQTHVADTIPFYNVNNLKVELLFELDKKSYLPLLNILDTTNSIYDDWKNGISLQRFTDWMELISNDKLKVEIS